MKEERWSYRLDIFDGPTRCGKLEKGGSTLDLPFLFDVSGEIPLLVLPQGDGISGGLTVLDRTENDGPIQESVRARLISIGADRLTRAVGSFKIELTLTEGGEEGIVDIMTDRHSSYVTEDPSSLIDLITKIKNSDPVHPPVYLPGSGGSKDLEALLYLGVEVFDNTRAVSSALEGSFFTMNGEVLLKDRNDRSLSKICGCNACLENEDLKTADWLTAHNTEVMRRRLLLARKMLEQGSLREHVMGIISGDPGTMSVIRNIEKGKKWDVFAFTHTFRNRTMVPVTYKDDLDSPEFELWRRKIRDQYRPLDHKKILLLLPCSARKPYSNSRTHSNIVHSLKGVKGWKTACQRLVLTSPLGVVPMELEELYPASSYDIPVTGEWFHEEREFIRDLSSRVISEGNFYHIVSYHRDSRSFFTDEFIDGLKVPFTDIHLEAEENGSRPDHLLRSVLNDLITEKPDMTASENETREVLNMLDLSLSMDLSFEEGMRVKNTRIGRDLRKGKQPMFKLGTGGPVPYLGAAREIWEMDGVGKRVFIEDFTPRGILFNQGIDEVHGDIRPGDVVLVGTDKDLKAVGRAMVPGEIMRTGPRGSGVKILDHVR